MKPKTQLKLHTGLRKCNSFLTGFYRKSGTSAVYEASRILKEFYLELWSKENLTFNPRLILGGTDVCHDPDKNERSAFRKKLKSLRM